jgi:hypothetical protein
MKVLFVRDDEARYQPRPITILLDHQVESVVKDILEDGRGFGVKNPTEFLTADCGNLEIFDVRKIGHKYTNWYTPIDWNPKKDSQ